MFLSLSTKYLLRTSILIWRVPLKHIFFPQSVHTNYTKRFINSSTKYLPSSLRNKSLLTPHSIHIPTTYRYWTMVLRDFSWKHRAYVELNMLKPPYKVTYYFYSSKSVQTDILTAPQYCNVRCRVMMNY